jgi:transcription elongation factor Elf1
MGKRKSSAKAPPKKQRPKLETTFACPFCNAGKSQEHLSTPHSFDSLDFSRLPPLLLSEKSVHCDMDRERSVGEVKCNECGEKWSTKIHSLSEAIDIYSEWLDACEEANQD